MELSAKIVLVMLLGSSIPFIIAGLLNPEKSIMWGKSWQFKNENLEPSDKAIRLSKIGSIISIILVGLMIIFVILS